MAKEIWLQENKKYLQAIESVRIPDDKLHDVELITPKTGADFDKIPEDGGCYWIWTNEPVLHSLHKNPTPNSFDNGEIVYNGIAKDNVQNRIKHHLLGDINATWSGINMDIYFGETKSHRKKAWAKSGKVPYIKKKVIAKRATKGGFKKGDEYEQYFAIRTKEDFLEIYLSEEEKKQIANGSLDQIHFRNGINIFDEKHKFFDYRVYFITGISPLYLDFIEKKWREVYNLPKLCSYSSGR